MTEKPRKILRSFLRICMVLVLTFSLVFGPISNSFAATGGRISGGSFSLPSRSYSTPSYPGGSSYGGGGFGFNPFFFLPFPIYGFGGGGLMSLLVLLVVANFLIRTFRQITSDGGLNLGNSSVISNSNVSVAKLQVGLSAQARYIQDDLDRIARTSNTNTNEGLTGILQETSLALLRHPEYWTYGITESKQARLNEAETVFNRLLLEERSRLTGETLANVKGQLQQDSSINLTHSSDKTTLNSTLNGNSEYIVVTILVGTQSKLQLPPVNDSDGLRQAVRQIGSIPSDQLMVLEVIWSPQSKDESLTADELVARYPNLKLI